MKKGDQCKILKIYVSEDSRYKGHSLYHSILFKLKELGVAGVTVSRAIEGYGKGKAIHAARILDLSASLPIIIEAVDRAEKSSRLSPSWKRWYAKAL